MANAPSVFAEEEVDSTFDLERITCEEILALPSEDAGYAFVLLLGYSEGMSNKAHQSASAIERKIKGALTSTYDPIEDSSCDGIASVVTELDSILGADDDGAVAKDKRSTASDVTLNVIAGAAGGLIPFRGIVRRATGASKRENLANAAFRRGLARRAYLKGIGSQKGCEPPAAPATVS